MSGLKLVPDLYVGIPELGKLVDSLKENGFKTLSRATITSYGVVINDKLVNSLRLVPGSGGKVTVKSGLAIDSDHNYIIVLEDLVDVISLPDDSQEKYISISYKESTVEQGTVSISPDGTITGSGTKFTSLLRGSASKMPSRVRFIDSTNNIGEFIVNSVVNDTLAYLNVVSGVMTSESNQRFSIVGTFTPSVVIDESNKYPFLNDLYELKVSSTDISNDTTEFILGVATNSSGIVSISDKRDKTRMSTQDSTITQENPIVGVEWVKYTSVNSSGLNNSMQIGWGLISPSGSWSIDSLGEIVIGALKGGVWQNIDSLTDEDLLVGWRVVFPDGKTSRILSVNLAGSTAKLTTSITSSSLTGDLLIVPDCDSVEVLVKSQSGSLIEHRRSFDSSMRACTMQVESNTVVVVSYRHLKGNVNNGPVLRVVNDGQYLPESSFGSIGEQSSSALETTESGVVTLRRREDNLLTIFALVLPVGGIIDYAGAESGIPSNWLICDGREILQSLSPLKGQFTPNYKGRTSVGFDSSNNNFNVIKKTGGEEEVTLTAEQNGKHSHEGSLEMSPHSHQMKLRRGAHFDADTQPGGDGEGGRRTMFDSIDTRSTEDATSTGTVTIEESDGGESHNNLQPYLTVYKIMRIY